MLKIFPSNVFYLRLNRNQRPWVQAAQWVGGGLGVAVSLLATYTTLMPPFFQTSLTSGFPWEWLARVLPSILTVASSIALPLYLAYVAALITVNYIHGAEYQQLLTTLIPNHEVVQGFVLTAFSRCAPLLAFQMGVLPCLAAVLVSEAGLMYVPQYSGTLFGLGLGVLGVVLQFTLALLVIAFFVIGMNGLIVSLSVLFALWWRNSAGAASASAFGGLGLVLALLYMVSSLFILRPTYENYLAIFALAGLACWVLLRSVLRSAEDWVRK